MRKTAKLVAAGLGALAALWLGGSLHVRPVAADAPPGRFTLTATTAFDTQTTLTWQRTLNPSSLTFDNAQTYCTGLGAGYRLPTINELLTIVDDSRVSPSIDPAVFPNTPVEDFWSSSLWAGMTPAAAHSVNFNYGIASGNDVTVTYRVRCVR